MGDEKRTKFWNSIRGSFLETADSSRVLNLAKKLGSGTSVGGNAAAQTLEELINSVGTPGSADALRYSGVLAKATAVLKNDSASDYEKGLAGSLITLLTDMPVSAES